MIPSIFIALAFCQLPPFVEYQREWDGHANGVYWKSELFVAVPDRPLPDWKLRLGESIVKYSSCLFRSSPPSDGRISSPPIRFPVYGTIGPDLRFSGSAFRFSISRDHAQFYAGIQNLYFPIEDFQLLEMTGLGKELFDLKYNPQREPSNQIIPFMTYSWDQLCPNHREWDLPEVTFRQRLMEAGWAPSQDKTGDMLFVREAYVKMVRWDSLPIDAFRLRLFQVLDERLFISTEPVALHHPNKSLALGKKPAPIPPRDLRSGKLPASFKGRFHAYVVGDLHYLLTAGGRLYKCDPKDKDGLEITEVWSDPAQPLIGIVDCPETKQAFAFGWGNKPGNTDRYWVEFGDKPAATAYKLKSKLKNNREDAFREVSDCVDALKAMKAIKPAPKPDAKK